MKSSRSEPVAIRNKTVSVRHWGDVGAPVIFMFHGWIDCSATFQFVIDEMRRSWHIIAPDWRGHGGSHRTGETYPFLQLIADVDAILEHYSPHEPVRLVGHSLGANTSAVYAGTRPERLQRFVNLEGIAPVPALSRGTPAERMSRWLAVLRKGVRNRPYNSHVEMAERLRQANPRLTAERAAFLAREFSIRQEDGSFEFAIDPYQQAPSPFFGHESLVESVFPLITAPVLLVTAAQSDIFIAMEQVPGLFAQRLALMKKVEHVHLQEAGHNVHHDQPEQVAALIERFLS